MIKQPSAIDGKSRKVSRIETNAKESLKNLICFLLHTIFFKFIYYYYLFIIFTTRHFFYYLFQKC